MWGTAAGRLALATRQGCTRALAQKANAPMMMQGEASRVASRAWVQLGMPGLVGCASKGVCPPTPPAWLPPCLPTSRPAASVEGYGEGATTLVSKEQFRFLVDEPPKLGGKGMGTLPLLVGASWSWRPQPPLARCCLCNSNKSPHKLAAKRPLPRQSAEWSAGPNPLTVLLGSLVGCTQYTASMISQELKLGSLEGVVWKAAGELAACCSACVSEQHDGLGAPSV
jgi:hypothetical protein